MGEPYNEPDAPDAADYDYPYDDDGGLDEDGNFPFECAAYWTGADWHCPMAGAEDCDWECPGHPGEPERSPAALREQESGR